MAEGESGTATPIQQWLNNNGLKKLSQAFEEEEMSLDDLVHMKEEHLEEWMQELKMKAVMKHKLIRAVKKHQKETGTEVPSNVQSERMVVLSERESRMLKIARSKAKEIQQSIQLCGETIAGLVQRQQDESAKIDEKFTILATAIEARRKVLQLQLKRTVAERTKSLETHLEMLDSYDQDMKQFEKKYDALLKDVSLDMNKRARQVSEMVQTLTHNGEKEQRSTELPCDDNVGLKNWNDEHIIAFLVNLGAVEGQNEVQNEATVTRGGSPHTGKAERKKTRGEQKRKKSERKRKGTLKRQDTLGGGKDPFKDYVYAVQARILVDMGFTDVQRVKFLLSKHNANVDSVLEALIEG